MKLARDIIALCSQVSEDLAHVDVALPGILAAIHADASTPHVRAQSFDGVRVSGTRADVVDFGDGDELVIFPTDPTGEAVAHSTETEEAALRDILGLVRAVQGPVAALLARAQRWQLIEHEMTTTREVLRGERAEQARVSASVERENECCGSCRRYYVREPHGSDPGQRRIITELFTRSSNVKGKLDRRMALCEWCWRFVDRTGHLPTTEQIADHHHGRRVVEHI